MSGGGGGGGGGGGAWILSQHNTQPLFDLYTRWIICRSRTKSETKMTASAQKQYPNTRTAWENTNMTMHIGQTFRGKPLFQAT